jgi:hypothetical protein
MGIVDLYKIDPGRERRNIYAIGSTELVEGFTNDQFAQ